MFSGCAAQWNDDFDGDAAVRARTVVLRVCVQRPWADEPPARSLAPPAPSQRSAAAPAVMRSASTVARFSAVCALVVYIRQELIDLAEVRLHELGRGDAGENLRTQRERSIRRATGRARRRRAHDPTPSAISAGQSRKTASGANKDRSEIPSDSARCNCL